MGGFKRVQLHRKTPTHLAGYGREENSPSRPRVWKEIEVLKVPGLVTMLPRFRGCIRVTRLMNPWTGLGLGREFWVVRAHVSRLCMNRCGT